MREVFQVLDSHEPMLEAILTGVSLIYSSSQLSEVHHEKPNPQPLPYKGRGARIKASLLLGERFGERSDCISFNREGL
jgi:hypothetical protein